METVERATEVLEDVRQHLGSLVCTVLQDLPWDVVEACSFAGVDSLKALPHICCSHTGGVSSGGGVSLMMGGQLSGSSKRA